MWAIPSPKTLGLLFAGSAGGSGTAYGVTKSHLDAEVKSLKLVVQIKDSDIEKLEGEKKTLQDTITSKDRQIGGLKQGIRDRDADTENMVLNMKRLTDKVALRRVDWCGYFQKPGKAENVENRGRYIDKAGKVQQWHLKGFSVGCFKDGSY